MSSIYDLLAQIKNAVYGKDVRDAIHDSIEQCYDDATGTPESIAGAVADIQSYKEQTNALISNYESQFNTMMADYEDRIDAQVDNLVANVKPNTVVNLWRGIYGTEPDGTTNDVYTLSDDISNYDYIDIYAQSSYYTPVRVRVDKSSGSTLAKVTNIESSGFPHPDNKYLLINETHIMFEGNGNEGVVNYTLKVTDRAGTETYDWNDTEMSPLFIERIDGIKVGADSSAEIADIRVGEDGTVYQTAGAAVRGQIADVKADLSDLQEEIEGGGSGLTADLKAALDQLAQKVAYIDDDGADYYDALHNALYPPEPPKTVLSISAVYTQSGTVYDTDSLNSLKSDLVVTATYDDSTSEVVTNYTLSGTLTEGTSTITVSYGGKTTTFTVTVTHNEQPLYDWNFTESLVDSVGGVTAVLTGCTRDSNGVNFTSASQAIQLTSDKVDVTDKTFIIDIPSMTLTDSGSNHARFLCSDSTDTNTASGAAAFVYRHNYGWTVYSGSSWGTAFNKTTYPIDFFNNKRVKIYIDTDRKLTVSYASIGSNSFTEIGTIALAFDSTYGAGYLVIGGSNTNNFSPVTISAIKIYEGEV